jgi:Subtilase family
MTNNSKENGRGNANNKELIDPSVYGDPDKYIIQIKFKENTDAKLSLDSHISSNTGIDLSNVENILKKYDTKLERAFDETEESLMAEARDSKSHGIDLPDLSRYYVAYTHDKEKAVKLTQELSKEESIDSTEVIPSPVPASIDLTISFVNRQGYLGPAPGGVDAHFAWTIPGGKGTGIKVIDIEGSWNFSHEDLLQNQNGLAGGSMNANLAWRDHGTAVLGEMGGDENDFGITGIAPRSVHHGYSIFGPNNAFHVAMKKAADLLLPGDIILIELHAPGPDASGQGQDGYIAMEYWDLNFDAIKYATSKGIIVVEAAGNGSRNLDHPVFQNKFNRSLRDSGAIVVGAGAPPSGNYGPDRSRLGFSNWGNIVDAQGWGREVITTGYGDLQGGNENKWYCAQFSGTSSASPIIVGVISCLQGIRKAKGEPPLTFGQIRNLLHTTGSLQQDAPNKPKTQRIGNRPDLKNMIKTLWP